LKETYTIYIIQNEEGIFYKGFTTDIENRLIQHNSSLGKYTSSRGPWKLVYTKEYGSKREALIEEKRIKRLNKASLLKLIGENTCLSSRHG
jgi:putative endonuclease